jgi:hypothetical protein
MLVANDVHHMNSGRRTAFDDLLFEICEELQLSPSRHALAEQRYKTIGELLGSDGSPFAADTPNIYPQGSMRLGTTVKPIDGPFDLDFVLHLSRPFHSVDPMDLLDQLFSFFKESDRYKGMTEKKNRCIRIVYADDFYMDILPACDDTRACSTCIQVPDVSAEDWKGSNPLGYASWFHKRSQYRMYKFSAEARDMQPLPALQPTEEKEVLQLVVQLLKRWRDLFYSRSKYPPISVVLTTLAANLYDGEASTAEALLNVLDGIVHCLDVAHAKGERLKVLNPVHEDEDFSERWNNRDEAYKHFDLGIRHFAKRWREIYLTEDDPKKAFGDLFGAVVGTVVEKRATRLQAARGKALLGVMSSGVITSASASASVARIRPNTNHGDVASR